MKGGRKSFERDKNMFDFFFFLKESRSKWERESLSVSQQVFGVWKVQEMCEKGLLEGILEGLLCACVCECRQGEGLRVCWGCGLERCRHPWSIWCELYCKCPCTHTHTHKHKHTHKVSALKSYYRLCSSVISRAPGLKLVVETLMSSLKPIGNIVVICCAFFIIFGILGVQVRRGRVREGEERRGEDAEWRNENTRKEKEVRLNGVVTSFYYALTVWHVTDIPTILPPRPISVTHTSRKVFSVHSLRYNSHSGDTYVCLSGLNGDFMANSPRTNLYQRALCPWHSSSSCLTPSACLCP